MGHYWCLGVLLGSEVLLCRFLIRWVCGRGFLLSRLLGPCSPCLLVPPWWRVLRIACMESWSDTYAAPSSAAVCSSSGRGLLFAAWLVLLACVGGLYTPVVSPPKLAEIV